ncbi:MAG: HD domain-containing phosphohydrolase [Burkholderiaceae bacterium]
MNAPQPLSDFSAANPHALATILEASKTKSIIASRDIFDISGTKLWARDQPVSGALQRKLLDRKLRNPLESCLLAEDGVTVQTLVQATQAMLDSETPLSVFLRRHGAKIMREIAYLPLHSVAQLLLTAGQASRPESFDHAVKAMALCGGLMIEHGGATADLRLAMLCGLLHDLGEMYIDPRYGEFDADRALDLQSYEHLVVHPHVGYLLIAQLTDYPATVARAVAEHHERLDGSGYPHGLQRDKLSPLGRLLAVTEGSLGVLRGTRPTLARVSVALRVIPGEFELGWVGGISDAARAQPIAQAVLDTEEVQARLARLDTALRVAKEQVDEFAVSAVSPAFQGAMTLAQYLLARLRTGWYASGLWSGEALQAQDVAEVAAVEDELFFRLRSIERAVLLRAGKLDNDEARRLDVLCEAFRQMGA